MSLPTSDTSVKASQLIVGFQHIAVSVRDTAEAARFWTAIFHAELCGGHRGNDDLSNGKSHLLAGNIVLHNVTRPGLTGWELEYPHHGFTVSSPDMLAIKDRLERAGVRTHPIWTRNEVEGLMYFRDPSGNLFELYCPHLESASDRATLHLASSHGGDFLPPVADLTYDWDAPRAERALACPDGVSTGPTDDERCLLEGHNHLTVPVRNMEEAARFWTQIFEAELIRYLFGRPSHVRMPGNFVLHFSENPGLVSWEHEYPHYCIGVTADGIRALPERLAQAGVRTQPLWTRHGTEARCYFRDPTGNLFEFYCEEFEDASDLEMVDHQYPHIAELTYDWKG